MQIHVNKAKWLSLFVLFTVAVSAQAQGTTPQIVAIVNGTQIPVSMVNELLRPPYPPPNPIPESQKQEMRKVALNMIIDDVLMRQFLAKSAPNVTAEQVQVEVNKLTAALSEKKVSLEKFLADSKQTKAELQDDILAKLRWEAYVKNYLPDSLLKKYYDTNKVFFDKVFVKASHILVKVDEKATAVDKQTARLKAQQIHTLLVNGQAKFEDAAKAYSDCPSKDKGGDIGFFPYKFAVAEPFARAAFSMQVGQISNVVETGFGFHVIKVTDRKPPQPSNFAEIKHVVRDVYVQDLQLHQRILAQLRKQAKIEVYLK